MSPDDKEFSIPFEESRKGRFEQQEEKALGRRLGEFLASRAINRPSIGSRRGQRGIRGFDVPTGGTPGSRKPTGSRRDFDGDGWADEGTSKPVWVGIDGQGEKKPKKKNSTTSIPARLASGKDQKAKLNVSRYGKNEEYLEVSSFEINGKTFDVQKGGDAVPGGYNGYLVAFDGDKNAGYLDYQTADGSKKATIAMISTDEGYRRQGIAEALLDSFMAENPGYEISPGGTTEDGGNWWRAVTGGDGPIRPRTEEATSRLSSGRTTPDVEQQESGIPDIDPDVILNRNDYYNLVAIETDDSTPEMLESLKEKLGNALFGHSTSMVDTGARGQTNVRKKHTFTLLSAELRNTYAHNLATNRGFAANIEPLPERLFESPDLPEKGGTSSGLSSGKTRVSDDIYEESNPSDLRKPSSLLTSSSDGKESGAINFENKTFDIKQNALENNEVSHYIEDNNGEKLAEIVVSTVEDESTIKSINATEEFQKGGVLEAILDSLLANNPETKFKPGGNQEGINDWWMLATGGIGEYGEKGGRRKGFRFAYFDGEERNPDGAYILPSRTHLKSDKIKSNPVTEPSGEKFEWSGRIFTIDGESVIFGAPEDVDFPDESVKKMSLNPFEISGLDPKSKEGRELALRWVSAVHGANAFVLGNDSQADYVGALLHASLKGDKKAEEEFNYLQNLSESLIKKIKDKKLKKTGDIDETKALPLNSQLVHQTRYKPTIDEDGYLVLRPLEDFPQTAKNGKEVVVNRTTLHFAINHLAEGHIFRTEEKGKSFVVISSLESFVEQNPDSLENLSVVDTAASPPPGEGLRFAPGTFKVIEVNEGEDARKEVEEAIKESGARLFKGGERQSETPGADDAARLRASMIGVSSSVASDLDVAKYELINLTNTDERFNFASVPIETQTINSTSKNGLLRIANRTENRWLSFDRRRIRDKNERLFSGATPFTPSSKKANREESDSTERLSSGWTYERIVENQQGLSPRQTEAVRDVLSILKDDEFKKIDEFDDVIDIFGEADRVSTDSEERKALKSRIENLISDVFSGQITTPKDVTLKAENGEEINLGNTFDVSVEFSGIKIEEMKERDLLDIEDLKLYDPYLDVEIGEPVPTVSVTMTIVPTKDAAKRLFDAGAPSELLTPWPIGDEPQNPRNIQLATASRILSVDTGSGNIEAYHQSFSIKPQLRGYGLGSQLNARNERIYQELGVSGILTQGNSDGSGMQGATHWPKNGFTWAGEKAKQDFLEIIHRAVTQDGFSKDKGNPTLFSDEERKNISSLYSVEQDADGKETFYTDASPEELLDFEQAEWLFQKRKASITYSRKVSSSQDRGLSSGRAPRYPRAPTLGAFLGDAEKRFDGITSWEEFRERYKDTEMVFLDYETTGLSFDEFGQASSNGKPTQIGLVRIKNGEEIGRLNLFMNPEEPLGEWSLANLKDADGNPITNEWLAQQMPISEAHQRVVDFIGEAIIGVQNATFDKNVLEDTLSENGIGWRPSGYLDTRDISAMTLPVWSEENPEGPYMLDRDGNKKPSSSLAAITEYLDVGLGEGHHNADADAFATSQVMQKIIDRAIENGWSTDVLDKEKRDSKLKAENDKFNADVEKFEAEKQAYISSQDTELLASGARLSEAFEEPIETSQAEAAAMGVTRERLAGRIAAKRIIETLQKREGKELSELQQRTIEDIVPGLLVEIQGKTLLDVELNDAFSETGKDLLNSISINVSSDGIPFVSADPIPQLAEQIPDKRDWRTVELPKRDDVIAIFEEALRDTVTLRDNTWLDSDGNIIARKAIKDDASVLEYESEEARQRFPLLEVVAPKGYVISSDSIGLGSLNQGTLPGKYEEAWKKHGAFLRELARRAGEAMGDEEFFLSGSRINHNTSTYLRGYIGGLTDPSKFNMGISGKAEQFHHDLFGHLGTGRGFDRHGEWANDIAMMSIVDHPDSPLTPEEKMAVKHLHYLLYSDNRMFRIGRLDESEDKPDFDDSSWSARDALEITPTNMGATTRETRVYAGDFSKVIEKLTKASETSGLSSGKSIYDAEERDLELAIANDALGVLAARGGERLASGARAKRSIPTISEIRKEVGRTYRESEMSDADVVRTYLKTRARDANELYESRHNPNESDEATEHSSSFLDFVSNEMLLLDNMSDEEILEIQKNKTYRSTIDTYNYAIANIGPFPSGRSNRLSSGKTRRPLIPMRDTEDREAVEKISEPVKVYKYGEVGDSGNPVRKTKIGWLGGMSSEQMAEVLVPQSREQMLEMWMDDFVGETKINDATRKALVKYFDEAYKEYVDFSPESVKVMRELIKESLDSNPKMKWAFEKHGAPMFHPMSRSGAELYESDPQIAEMMEKLRVSRGTETRPYIRGVASPMLDSVYMNPRALIDMEPINRGEGSLERLMNPGRRISDGDAHIDGSLQATLIHEWGHWLHYRILRDIEYASSGNRKYYGSGDVNDDRYLMAWDVGERYNDRGSVDAQRLSLHESGAPFSDEDEVPRLSTSYGHVNMREAMAEGMVAVLHLNEDIQKTEINKKLRDDVYSLLGIDEGDTPWSTSSKLSSGTSTSPEPASSGARIRRLTDRAREIQPEATEEFSERLSSGQANQPPQGEHIPKWENVDDIVNWEALEVDPNMEPEDKAEATKEAIGGEWSQWDPCREIRLAAYDLSGIDEFEERDPNIYRSGGFFGNSPERFAERSKRIEQARFLMAQVVESIRNQSKYDRPPYLYRAMAFASPEDEGTFFEAFKVGSQVDIPLLSFTSTGPSGDNHFLTKFGTDVLVELLDFPGSYDTGGRFDPIHGQREENDTLYSVKEFAEGLLSDIETGDYSDDNESVEADRQFAEKLIAMVDEYEELRRDDTQGRDKIRLAIIEAMEELGNPIPLKWSGMPLDEDDENYYSIMDDDEAENYPREYVSGGKLEVLQIKDDPSGLYKKIVTLGQVGAFDPEETGALVLKGDNTRFTPKLSSGENIVKKSKAKSTKAHDDDFEKKYNQKIPKGKGNCFSEAVTQARKLADAYEDVKVVHGYPLGTGGEAKGLRYPHAWVEFTENGIEMIRDYSNGNKFELPKDLYYAIGNMDEKDMKKYNIKQAEKFMNETQHYGPW